MTIDGRIKNTGQSDRQLPYAYWLDNIPGVGKVTIKKLLELAETPENVYYMPEKEVKEVLSQKQLKQYQNQKYHWDLYTEHDKLGKQQIRFIPYIHPAYPEKLQVIPDAPYGIYVKGELPASQKTSVAIIGARMCSEYGRFMAREFGTRLAGTGIQVISGMARGIDGISQKGAIDAGGQTFGVLGCGVDICYPEENNDLYQKMVKQGGILSEYKPGTMPQPKFFPPRNRIISGLSDVVLIIEAKQKSGTLITVDMALEQGKEVYALPGRTTDALSFGCNRLIKQGAGIVLSVEDFIEELCGLGIHRQESNIKYLAEPTTGLGAPNNSNWEILLQGMDEIEKKVVGCMDWNPQPVELIYEKVAKEDAGITVPLLLQVILQLQMKGIIAQKGASYFIKCK